MAVLPGELSHNLCFYQCHPSKEEHLLDISFLFHSNYPYVGTQVSSLFLEPSDSLLSNIAYWVLPKLILSMKQLKLFAQNHIAYKTNSKSLTWPLIPHNLILPTSPCSLSIKTWVLQIDLITSSFPSCVSLIHTSFCLSFIFSLKTFSLNPP